MKTSLMAIIALITMPSVLEAAPKSARQATAARKSTARSATGTNKTTARSATSGNTRRVAGSNTPQAAQAARRGQQAAAMRAATAATFAGAAAAALSEDQRVMAEMEATMRRELDLVDLNQDLADAKADLDKAKGRLTAKKAEYTDWYKDDCESNNGYLNSGKCKVCKADQEPNANSCVQSKADKETRMNTDKTSCEGRNGFWTVTNATEFSGNCTICQSGYSPANALLADGSLAATLSCVKTQATLAAEASAVQAEKDDCRARNGYWNERCITCPSSKEPNPAGTECQDTAATTAAAASTAAAAAVAATATLCANKKMDVAPADSPKKCRSKKPHIAVSYGANCKYNVQWYEANGQTINCNNGTFGDPNHGKTKNCWIGNAYIDCVLNGTENAYKTVSENKSFSMPICNSIPCITGSKTFAKECDDLDVGCEMKWHYDE